jgi:hypothetical protein
MQDARFVFPGMHQRVEKVGVELIATTNSVRDAPNWRFWCLIWGESEHQGSFSTRWHLPGTGVKIRLGVSIFTASG